MFKTRQKFGDSFLTIVLLLVSENTVRKIIKFDKIEHFGLSKKAAVVSNFCLIGKIHHNFLVPKMIELDFHAYSDPDLHRVLCLLFKPILILHWNLELFSSSNHISPLLNHS